MVAKNRKYRVTPVPTGLKKSYPMHECSSGIVTALENAPNNSLDVIDVKTANGKIKSVYSFQLKPYKR